jgi:hypothetical protein
MWGLDSVGPFCTAPGGYKDILVPIDKFTKWIEVRPIAKHYVKTSNSSRNICNGPLTPVTSTHIWNSCCVAPVTYKRARTTPGLASTRPVEGPIRRTREGGSEWEPIKILLERDENSNKTNTASNTRLRLTTQVGQTHVATGVPLDLVTNTHSLPTRERSGTTNPESTDPHRSDR